MSQKNKKIGGFSKKVAICWQFFGAGKFFGYKNSLLGALHGYCCRVSFFAKINVQFSPRFPALFLETCSLFKWLLCPDSGLCRSNFILPLPMKIAYLSTFYPFRGGIAQFNASLFQALAKSQTVEAFTFKRQYPELLFPGSSQYITPQDAQAEVINALPLLDTINPISYWTTAQKIRAFSPDLLLMKFWMPFFAPSLGTVAAKMLPKTKRVAILDNLIPHESRFLDETLIAYFLKNTDAYVVMSQAVLEDLLRFKPKAQYLLFPHPLYNHFGKKISREKALAHWGIEKDKKVLLFFGFIRKYKGLDLLLEAFAHLSQEYVLLIGGESYLSENERQALQNSLDTHPAAERIKAHIRYIPDEEVSLFFSAADVNILPYRSATQSGVTAIAYHFEVPVLVHDVGGLREIVEPYQTGEVLAPPFTPLRLAEKIRHFFQNQNPNDLSQNLRNFKINYSWEKLAQAIVSL